MQLDFLATGALVQSLGTIRAASTHCQLHRLVHDAFGGDNESDNSVVELFRSGSKLYLKGRPSPILSICRSVGKWATDAIEVIR